MRKGDDIAYQQKQNIGNKSHNRGKRKDKDTVKENNFFHTSSFLTIL